MSLLGGHFDAVPDPRREQGRRHALSDLFALTLCAVTAGANDFVAVEAFGRAQIDWLRRFFPMTGGVPSHDTLSRVFALVDRTHFEDAFAAWAAETFERTEGQTAPVIAVDGKRLRRAHNAGDSMMTVVSAWASQSRVAFGLVATTEGEGETSAIPRLLRLLDVSGSIVTLDAAGCQTDIAEQITDGGGDYVLAVKGNQGGLREDAERWLFEATLTGNTDGFETAERGHGRVETRKYWSAPVPEDALRKALWAGLTSVGMVESTRIVNGRTTTEQRYFASSLKADAETLARAIRGHWGVENGLHWVLDVAFREDESRARIDHAAANLAVVRRVSATLIQAEPTGKGGVQTRRMRAAWDGGYREKVLRLV
jgi:predicted transposase YbfD/YdcC